MKQENLLNIVGVRLASRDPVSQDLEHVLETSGIVDIDIDNIVVVIFRMFEESELEIPVPVFGFEARIALVALRCLVERAAHTLEASRLGGRAGLPSEFS